jgi:hypothetical protein
VGTAPIRKDDKKQSRRVSSQEWSYETASESSESDIEQEKSIIQGSVEKPDAKNELMKHVRRVRSQQKYQINKLAERKMIQKAILET